MTPRNRVLQEFLRRPRFRSVTVLCFSYTRCRTMTSKSVILTPSESLLRQCLIDCRDDARKESKGHSESVQLEIRFTGGWVRDKLRGDQSHDIDVALSTMTGWQFGQQLQKFVEKYGSEYEAKAATLGLQTGLKSLHQIAANPEKSKHLETITTRMFGFDIDFVNLRKETYSETSRNPQMEFGTAEEDALRRDATINALFFNLDTELVEDFTNRGLEDLKKKIIRTPLPSYQTFKDDPLRVLRLIRFASRFGYDIDPDAQTAMKDESIHHSLKVKISRERVGIEVGKMLSGPDPHRALSLIQDLDLYGAVFCNPSDTTTPEEEHLNPQVYKGVQEVLNSPISKFLQIKDDLSLCWYLAAYVAWANMGPIKAVAAAREGIKATNKYCKVLEEAVRNQPQVLGLLDMLSRNESHRSVIGMALRQLGSSWRWQILYSLLCQFQKHEPVQVIESYDRSLKQIQALGLENATELLPIINGQKIRESLQTKTGPWMKKALDLVMEWQLDHPSGSPEEAVDMVLSKRADLGLP